MQFLKHKTKSVAQRGDTIIEVMIVLAILGSAISIVYATASRSLLSMRRAQESSTATTLAQTQLEMLRTLAPNGKLDNSVPANIAKNVFNTQPYCIINSGGVFTVTLVTGPVSDAACRTDSLYNVRVYYCEASPHPECGTINAEGNFVIQVEWDDVGGDGKDTATLTYRAHSS